MIKKSQLRKYPRMLSKTSGEKVRGWIQEVLYSSNRKSEAEMTDNGRGRRRRGRKKSKT